MALHSRVFPADDSVATWRPDALKLTPWYPVAAKPGQTVECDEHPVGTTTVAVDHDPMTVFRAGIVNDRQDRSALVNSTANQFKGEPMLLNDNHAAGPQRFRDSA